MVLGITTCSNAATESGYRTSVVASAELMRELKNQYSSSMRNSDETEARVQYGLGKQGLPRVDWDLGSGARHDFTPSLLARQPLVTVTVQHQRPSAQHSVTVPAYWRDNRNVQTGDATDDRGALAADAVAGHVL
jgi:hypothetical protein